MPDYNFNYFIQNSKTIKKELKRLVDEVSPSKSIDQLENIELQVIEKLHGWAEPYAKMVANLYLQGNRSVALSGLYNKKQKIIEKIESKPTEKVKLEKELQRLRGEIDQVKKKIGRRSNQASFENYSTKVLGEPAIKFLNKKMNIDPTSGKRLLQESGKNRGFLAAISSSSSKSPVTSLLSASNCETGLEALKEIVELGKAYKPNLSSKHNFLLTRGKERRKFINTVNTVIKGISQLINKFLIIMKDLKRLQEPGTNNQHPQEIETNNQHPQEIGTNNQHPQEIESSMELEKKKLLKMADELKDNWNMVENFHFFIQFVDNMKTEVPATFNYINTPQNKKFLEKIQKQRGPLLANVYNKAAIMRELAKTKGGVCGIIQYIDKKMYPELFEYFGEFIRCIEKTIKFNQPKSVRPEQMAIKNARGRVKAFEAPSSFSPNELTPIGRTILLSYSLNADRVLELKSLDDLTDKELLRVYERFFKRTTNLKQIKLEEIQRFDPERDCVPDIEILKMALTSLKRRIKKLWTERFSDDSIDRIVNQSNIIPQAKKEELKAKIKNGLSIKEYIRYRDCSVSDAIIFYYITDVSDSDEDIINVIVSRDEISKEQKRILRDKLKDPNEIEKLKQCIKKKPEWDTITKYMIKDPNILKEIEKELDKAQTKIWREKMKDPVEVDKFLKYIHNMSKCVSLNNAVIDYTLWNFDEEPSLRKTEMMDIEPAITVGIEGAKLTREINKPKEIPKDLYRYINPGGIVGMLQEAGNDSIHLTILEKYIENDFNRPQNEDFYEWEKSWITECVNKLKPGTIIKHKSNHFCSTSKSLHFSGGAQFGQNGILLRITTSDETKGYFLNNLHEEFLLPTGQKFKITKVEESKEKPKGAVLEIYVDAIE